MLRKNQANAKKIEWYRIGPRMNWFQLIQSKLGKTQHQLRVAQKRVEIIASLKFSGYLKLESNTCRFADKSQFLDLTKAYDEFLIIQGIVIYIFEDCNIFL